MDELARALEAMQDPVPRRKTLGEGWVYFIQRGADGPIKIGFTTREPEERLAQLQVGSPDQLLLIGYEPAWTISYERELHKRFSEHKLSREWFEPTAPILDHIKSLWSYEEDRS